MRDGEEVGSDRRNPADRIYWNICVTLLINSNALAARRCCLKSRFEESLKRDTKQNFLDLTGFSDMCV